MTIRKWEFVINELKRINAPVKVVDAAKKIDEVCARIYGKNTHTISWIWYESTLKELNSKNEIFYRVCYVVQSTAFCIACEVKTCSECKLAKEIGRCNGFYKENPYTIVDDWLENNMTTYERSKKKLRK